MEKTCPRCGKLLPIDMFAWKSQALGRRASECKPCHKELRRAYYVANRDREIENAKLSKRVRMPRIKADFKAFKKSLKCNRCGENHPATLQFHHSDPSMKDGSLARMSRSGLSMEGIMREVRKCEVLCANCHAIEHYGKYFAT